MRPAEIIFRVASGVGGWLIVLSYAVTLAALPAADCAPGDETLWRGTLVFGAVAGLAALLCGVGRPWRRWLRWLPLLAAPLVAYDAWWLALAVDATTLGQASLCAASPLAPTDIERLWPVFQLAVLAVATREGVRSWRG